MYDSDNVEQIIKDAHDTQTSRQLFNDTILENNLNIQDFNYDRIIDFYRRISKVIYPLRTFTPLHI